MLLGTSPYETKADRQRLRYEGVNENDESFHPVQFVSSKDNRVDFQRLNSRDRVLDSVQDAEDAFEQTSVRGVKLAVDMDRIRDKVHMPEKSVVRSQGARISFNYDHEEESVDVNLSKTPRILFRKKAKKKKKVKDVPKEATFVPSKQVYNFKVTVPPPPKDYIHFRARDKQLSDLLPSDYNLVLQNFKFAELPYEVDRLDYYLFLQDRAHQFGSTSDQYSSYTSLSSLLLNSFRTDRFVDSTEVTESTSNSHRWRRKEVAIQVPKWLVKRLTR